MSEHQLEQKIRKKLEGILDPETGKPIGKTGQLGEIHCSSDVVEATIALTTFAGPLTADIESEAAQAVGELIGSRELKLSFSGHHRAAMPLGTVGLRAKAVIAVGSGKGGVGKSTAATSLAIALHRAGCRTGLLDTDVYGPSIPHLTGVRGHVARAGEKIAPVDFNGMPIMSIGFMVPPDQAVIWRGPMLHSTVQTFVRDVDWGELDFLIIDMPPGTGDVALSLSQLLPVTGAVVVCTPQEVALIDAVKAVSMFEKVKIPVVGLIENMSSFICPDNGKRYDIFGKGGVREFAGQANVPFLGEMPIHIGLREKCDEGQIAAAFEDPQIAPYLEAISLELCRGLAARRAEQGVPAQLPVLG